MQSGAKFRMKGKGVKNIKGYGKGDQYVTIKVVTPKNLTTEQRDLLQKLNATFKTAESEADSANKINIHDIKKKRKKPNHLKKNKGFFGKMKEAVEDLFEEE